MMPSIPPEEWHAEVFDYNAPTPLPPARLLGATYNSVEAAKAACEEHWAKEKGITGVTMPIDLPWQNVQNLDFAHAGVLVYQVRRAPDPSVQISLNAARDQIAELNRISDRNN
jgi:hypothetical protein